MTREVEAGFDADADRAIMGCIRESRRARELPRVGPFALLFTSATRLRFLNYAIPDDGADTRTVRDLPSPDGIIIEALSDDVTLLEMVRLQHEIFEDPEPADERSVARLRDSLSRGGRALICRDVETSVVVGAAQHGVPAGGATEVIGVAVAPSSQRRGLAATMVSALARHGLDAGLAAVFLEAAPGADGVYRNAGFLRTSTSVHISLERDAEA